MDIHIIRLRGGWECTELGRPDAPASRLDLPAGPDSFPAGRLRLTRRFNRPPRAGIGPVVLRLAHCPGILAISLNGQPLVAGSPGRAEFELSLGLLAPRNELQIEAEPAPDAEGWGVVHLVFGAPAGGLPTNG